jgi:hypothetical protein
MYLTDKELLDILIERIENLKDIHPYLPMETDLNLMTVEVVWQEYKARIAEYQKRLNTKIKTEK